MPERDEETGRLIQYRGPAESPDCGHCPCARHGRPEKAVRAFGATGGFCIVAEAPGSEELFQGYPLVGPTGKLLNMALKRGNIDRNLAWVTNALLCRRPQDENQFARAVECCRPRLQNELALIKPTGIIAMGGTAARALQLPVTVIGEARGTVQDSPIAPGVPVVTTLHPASLFKGGAGEVSGGGKNKMNVDAQMMFLQADIEKAHAVAMGLRPPIWSDDGSVVTTAEGALEAMTTILVEIRAWGMLGLDMEWSPPNQQTGKITWLGLGHAGKWSGGSEGRAIAFWKPALPPEVLKLVADAMADLSLPKLIHNLQADKTVWERDIGSPMRGTLNDTMLMHHAAFPGLAHDLQQVASQFLVVPPWKTQRREQRKETEKRLAAEAKAAAKAEKKRMHEDANEKKKAEAEVIRAAKKVADQAKHEAKNAAAAAEKEAKRAQKQADHEARNAQSAADAAARKAARKAGAAAPTLPPVPMPPPASPPSLVVPVLDVGPRGPAGYQFSVIDDDEGVFVPSVPVAPQGVPSMPAKIDPPSLSLPLPAAPAPAPVARLGKIAAAIARMQAAGLKAPTPPSAPAPAPGNKKLKVVIVGTDGKETEVK